MPPSFEQLIDGVKKVVPQANGAWLYGSIAKGVAHDTSDVDIALMLPRKMTTEQKWDWANQLHDFFKREVDLVDFAHTTTVLQQQILTTGTRLFCDDPTKMDSYEAFCRTEYLNLQNRRQAQLSHIFKSGRVFS